MCAVCLKHGPPARSESKPRAAKKAAKAKAPYTLTEQLEELERTNPEVRKAKEQYDRTVAKVVKGLRSVERPGLRKEDAACCVKARDELGRMPIGYCSPTCSRRPL